MPENTTEPVLRVADSSPSRQLFIQLIQANHILHYHNVVDAYGHISVRNPQNHETFFMSRSLAPALVSTTSDIEEYRIGDASPVTENAAKGYSERFIHSEIYKRYAGVNSVVHAHAEVVLPFTISSIPLQPVFHVGAAMGALAPVYDIEPHYDTSDKRHTLLVNNEHLGASLAAGFNPKSSVSKTATMIKNYLTSQTGTEPSTPPCKVVLMRGHGFSCVGESIEEAVYRAVYTCSNARVQTTTLLMQSAYNLGHIADRFGGGDKNTGPAKQEPIHYLSDRAVQDTAYMHAESSERPWKMWCAEVANSSLYKNALIMPSVD